MAGSLARAQWPSAVASAAYDAANELTSWNGAAFAHDANGNTTSDGSRIFTWNARNQLVSIGGTASFQYDGMGRRIGKTVGASTTFLYDGVNSIQENSGAASILAGGIDEFFLRTDGNGSVVPITDALGSVLALVDSSGVVQTQYTYDAFGGTSASGTASTNSLEFTGRENDGTGLYYYRARYYDPAIGRFISEDPLGIGAGSNVYRYVDNSPTNATDPFGLWSTDAHNQIIWNALDPCGVSDADIWQIQQGSHFVDTHFQGSQWSYVHAMRDGSAGPSPMDAQAATANFITSEMNEAANVRAMGGVSQSMFLFGVAMHPVMDATSPAHTDYSGNPIAWCGLFGGCSKIFQHGGDSDSFNPFSIEDVAHLNANPKVQKIENFMIATGSEPSRGAKRALRNDSYL